MILGKATTEQYIFHLG